MTDRERIITSFEKCIRIMEDGEMVSDCEHCPYKSKEWEEKGFAACDEFSELTVEVPWQLADDLLKLAKDNNVPDKKPGGLTSIGYNYIIDQVVNRKVQPPEEMYTMELRAWLTGYAKCQNDIIDIINKLKDQYGR